MTRLRFALLLVASVLGSCAVDTELGLEAIIDRGSVVVAADDVVTARLDVTYRVGDYATGERAFQPQAIQLFVGDALVATMTPNAPPGFVGRVSPGESFAAVFTADDASATDPRRLCGVEVRIFFRWLDASVTEIGMTEAVTSDVTCE